MKTLTRKQVIDILIQEDIIWIRDRDTDDQSLNWFLMVHTGYDNYTNEGLKTDYLNAFAENIEIV